MPPKVKQEAEENPLSNQPAIGEKKVGQQKRVIPNTFDRWNGEICYLGCTSGCPQQCHEASMYIPTQTIGATERRHTFESPRALLGCGFS